MKKYGFFLMLMCLSAKLLFAQTVSIKTSFRTVGDDYAMTCIHGPSGTFSAVVDEEPSDHEEWVVEAPVYKWTIAPSAALTFAPTDQPTVNLSLSGAAFGVSYGVSVEVKWIERNTETGESRTIAAGASMTLDAVKLVGFQLVSDEVGAGGLIDNREATATIDVAGCGDPSYLSFMFTSHPVEENTINKMGTGISFAQTSEPLVWKTSKIFWYGVLPDRCCWDKSTSPYRFELTMNGCCKDSKDFSVDWPGDFDDSISYDCRKMSQVHNPEEIHTSDGSYYRCLIEFLDFRKTASRVGNPTNQYADEIIKEENYHVKQFLGLVPLEDGGQGDCFTAKGIRWHLGIPENVSFYVTGSTPDDALAKAQNLLAKGESEEYFTSTVVWSRDLYAFVEIKAKEVAGYNAAFKYHCTYEPEYGLASQQINHAHPAYSN